MSDFEVGQRVAVDLSGRGYMAPGTIYDVIRRLSDGTVHSIVVQYGLERDTFRPDQVSPPAWACDVPGCAFVHEWRAGDDLDVVSLHRATHDDDDLAEARPGDDGTSPADGAPATEPAPAVAAVQHEVRPPRQATQILTLADVEHRVTVMGAAIDKALAVTRARDAVVDMAVARLAATERGDVAGAAEMDLALDDLVRALVLLERGDAA